MAPHLSSIQRAQVLTLRAAKLPLSKIASQLQISVAQVRYTIRVNTTEISKRSGRPCLLTNEQIERVVDFVSKTPENQDIPWAGIGPALGLDCSMWSIRRALRQRGFSRGNAIGKTVIADAVSTRAAAAAAAAKNNGGGALMEDDEDLDDDDDLELDEEEERELEREIQMQMQAEREREREREREVLQQQQQQQQQQPVRSREQSLEDKIKAEKARMVMSVAGLV